MLDQSACPKRFAPHAFDPHAFAPAPPLHSFAGLRSPHSLRSQVSLDVGDDAAAAGYFTQGYSVYARPPFYTWHEGNSTDGSAEQGAPNLVTGAGGFLQSVWAGYGGVRFDRSDGALTLKAPRPLPNSTRLVLRGLHFLGARLDVEASVGTAGANDAGWSVVLSAAMTPEERKSAPPLELVMTETGEAEAITDQPLKRSAGTGGVVRRRKP